MTSPNPPGYLTALKTMWVEALKDVFDAEYPEADFRDIFISLDYPTEEHNFPSIWLDYEDVQDVQTAGIGHAEYGEPDAEGNRRKYKRWRYGGFMSLTVVAYASLERDRLCDELIALFAFGDENSATAQFRYYIENNEFVACDVDWDRLKVTATAANSGTSYGTEGMLYERTIALSVFGEFISDGVARALAKLSAVEIEPYAQGIESQPPFPTDDGGPLPSAQPLPARPTVSRWQ